LDRKTAEEEGSTPQGHNQGKLQKTVMKSINMEAARLDTA